VEEVFIDIDVYECDNLQLDKISKKNPWAMVTYSWMHVKVNTSTNTISNISEHMARGMMP
jgi:hypothetical protein